MSNPNPSRKNLAPPFQKGVSGNPGGRPKKIVTDEYKKLLDSPLPEDIRKKLKLKVGAKWKQAVVLGQMRKAIMNTDAAREITDRVEGKALQGLRIEGPDGGPVLTESNDADELRRSLKSLTDAIRNRRRKS